MAGKRQNNWQGQQRVDVSHLRSIESGVAYDLDDLAGRLVAGGYSLVVKGFTISTAGVVGQPATSLVVSVAGGMLLHVNGSEAGTILSVPGAQAGEVLNPNSNSLVTGAFSSSQTNYVGLDYARTADATTSANTAFLDASTRLEKSQTVPLARVLKYKFVISTSNFSANPNILPIAKVVTDANNNVVSVTDARQMLFRLGKGGDSPDSKSFWSWPTSRNESTYTDSFNGGDKSLGSQKDWQDSVMTRLWEIGGGEYWYSATSDRDMKLIRNPGSVLANGENFSWDGTNLTWSGLKIVWANSTAYYNIIANQTVSATGLTNLAVGDCLYVDVDRTSTATVTPQKGTLLTLGTPVIPGSRVVLVWRTAEGLFARDQSLFIGSGLIAASTAATGGIRLLTAPYNGGSPWPAPYNTVGVVAITNQNTTALTYKQVVAAGLTRGDTESTVGAGSLKIGNGANDTNTLIGTPLGGLGSYDPGDVYVVNKLRVYTGATGGIDTTDSDDLYIGYTAAAIFMGTNGAVVTAGGNIQSAGIVQADTFSNYTGIATTITGSSVLATTTPDVIVKGNVNRTATQSAIFEVRDASSNTLTRVTQAGDFFVRGGHIESLLGNNIEIGRGLVTGSTAAAQVNLGKAGTTTNIGMYSNYFNVTTSSAQGSDDIAINTTSTLRNNNDMVIRVTRPAGDLLGLQWDGNLVLGSAGVANGEYKYGNAITRRYHVSPIDMQQVSGGTWTLNWSGTGDSAWTSATDATAGQFAFRIPIPAGATVTGAELIYNLTGGTAKAANLHWSIHDWTGANFDNTATLGNPSTIALTVGAGKQITAAASVTSRTMTSDGFLQAMLTLTSALAGTQVLTVYSLRVTYTQPKVTPAC
jgi:hypothetical protein